MEHRQVFVKVNAPVDIGVSPVVQALSLIPRLWTIASCEGREYGFVDFRYGHRWCEAAEFLVCFSKLFVADEVDISASWGGGHELALKIRFPKRAMTEVADKIVKAAKGLRSIIPHSSPCFCGTAHREFRNSTAHRFHQRKSI